MKRYIFDCIGNSTLTPSSWKGEIVYIQKSANHVESEVVSRDSLFHIMIGKYKCGNYLCIPDWSIGMELAAFDDYFWTLERLYSRYPKLNPVDAVSIAYAIGMLAKISQL